MTPSMREADGSTSRGRARSTNGERAPRCGGGDVLPVEHDPGRTGAADDDVGVGELGVEVVPRDGADTERGDELVGALDGAVGHRDALGGDAAVDECAHGEARHGAGTGDEESGGGRLGDRAGSVEPGRDGGRRQAVDAGLGVAALADAQRLLEQRVEHRADGGLGLRAVQGVADLPEDLALAEDHRVQAGGDREEVGDRGVVVVHVDVLGELVAVEVGVLGEQARHLLDGSVEPLRLDDDLDAVAGGDDRGLGDRRRLQGTVRQLDGGVGVERGALEQLDRGGLVGHAHDQDAHASTSAVPSSGVVRGLALLVIGEDLQLDREVDLADVDAVGHGDDRRREVEDAGDAGGHERVGDVLRGLGGGGDDGDRDVVATHDLREVGERLRR